jgi:hypothetical protein
MIQRFRYSLLLVLLLLLPNQSFPVQAGCVQDAQRWIDNLDDRENSSIFHNHVRSVCRFSGQWVKEAQDVHDRPRRERMCNDLVLIWAHKECNFFRDQINPKAYEPCKIWTREMFRNCMDNNVDWFP